MSDSAGELLKVQCVLKCDKIKREMDITVARVDSTLPLPKYESAGAVGFDFVAREAIVVEPKKVGLVPGNVIVEVPLGYVLMVSLRSSTPHKKGLIMPHGVGIIDHDYCGPGDEIKIQVFNVTEKPVTVERGERIAQGIFVHIEKAVWNEVPKIERTTRGGFGSTG